jgi:NodT family efflux transporter outer membrane factor (OMF) lipoprotein
MNQLQRKLLVKVHCYQSLCPWSRSFNTQIGLLSLICILFLLLANCAPRKVNQEMTPLVDSSPVYSLPVTGDTTEQKSYWWEEFNDPLLSSLINKSLSSNFTLKQANERIKQAHAVEKQTTAQLYPEVTGELSGTSTWTNDGEQQERYLGQVELSWETDLWARLSSRSNAAFFEAQASLDDLEAIALVVSSQVAEIYFQITEQKLQLALLDRQIELGEKFYALTKVRFANGAASIVDVYQQSQQLAATRTQLPIVRANLYTLTNRLYVLSGSAPGHKSLQITDALPQLPQLPELGIPADLLTNRPDLRSLHNNLIATDYLVAEAEANRLPQIRLGASGGFQGSEFTSDGLFLSLFGGLVSPLIDWGERKAEVERRQAIVNEELARYTQVFLVAIEEVENALWLEQQQKELIDAVNEQFKIAKANLSETRSRYMQGLSDYLPVLAALQSVQTLEREILLRHRQLILIRILLYRALGGQNLMAGLENADKQDEGS